MPGRRKNAYWKRTLKPGVKRVKSEILQFHKAHGWALMQELHSRTPKKTGALADNWTSFPASPGLCDPTRETGTIFYARQASLKVGESIFIVNDKPYARRIEHGWGKNNPATGFVGPSLIAYKSRLKKT